MLKLKLLLVLLAASVLCACEPDSPKTTTYSVQGTVRNVWCHATYCDVVFEHDSGETSTIRTSKVPPIWAGEHCILTLTKPCQQCTDDSVVSSRRLP
jgi:hypothetical protein